MKLLVPEVVQTSAMDCGPAALASLLAGCGVPVSYARLRDACQTQVDGTSIDVLEQVANELGLVAEQTLIPVDHMLTRGVDAFPAIVVMRGSNGLTHFVVAWRRHGRLVQVMDPAIGRRFVGAAHFESDLYQHTAEVPRAQAQEWVAGAEMAAALTASLAALGVDAAPLLAAARADDALQGIARLDAATRATRELVGAGALRRGAEASASVRALVVAAAEDPKALPDSAWAIRCSADAVQVRGAVCLRAVGRRPAPDLAALPSDLRAAATEPPARPLRLLIDIARQAGARWPAALAATIVVAVLGAAVEALLLRGIFDLARDLGALPQRLGAFALLLAWILALTVLEGPLRGEVRRIGRLLEGAVRVAFLERLPLLADRYLSSRPASDLAQRAHALHKLRALPELAADALRTATGLVVTSIGLVWLDPTGAPLVLLALACAVGVPIACLPAQTEQDLRLRVHGGALFQFFLDALLGLVAVRSHSAERALRREHEALLVEWVRAGRALLRTNVMVSVLQGLLPFAAVATLVGAMIARSGDRGGVLLFVYWALQLPALGQELALVLRQAPQLRNVTLRILEPLGPAAEIATHAPAHTTPRVEDQRAAVALSLRDVDVVAGGQRVLEGITLEIKAGEHVAIVGPSGAGKSSLVGLFLGWHKPSAGAVLVDGEPLDVEALRQQLAWLDPAVQLWGRSLLGNLSYGVRAAEMAPVDRILEDAELVSVLQRLPHGLNSHVGDGGGLLSGGEGQRVRFGRALGRQAPRLALLDEPFRGLDRDRRRALLATARARFAHATLVCITHDIDETQAFARVIVIDGGRVVQDGPPARLLEEGGVYRALLEGERALTTELWGDSRWQRVHLGGGAA